MSFALTMSPACVVGPLRAEGTAREHHASPRGVKVDQGIGRFRPETIAEFVTSHLEGGMRVGEHLYENL